MKTFAEVKKVIPVEAILVELVDFHHHVPVNVFPQGPLGPRLAGDEGLQHGPHHVQLGRAWPDVSSRNFDLKTGARILFPGQSGVIVRLDAPLPLGTCLPDTHDDAPDVILLCLGRLPQRVPELELHKVLELGIDAAPDAVREHGLHAGHQHLQPLDHSDHLDQGKLLVTGVIVAGGPLVLLGLCGALLVLVVVGGVQQLPGVELRDHTGPLTQQLQASQRQVEECSVL